MLFPHPRVPVEITYIDVTDKECVILNSSESYFLTFFLAFLIFNFTYRKL